MDSYLETFLARLLYTSATYASAARLCSKNIVSATTLNAQPFVPLFYMTLGVLIGPFPHLGSWDTSVWRVRTVHIPQHMAQVSGLLPTPVPGNS